MYLYRQEILENVTAKESVSCLIGVSICLSYLCRNSHQYQSITTKPTNQKITQISTAYWDTNWTSTMNLSCENSFPKKISEFLAAQTRKFKKIPFVAWFWCSQNWKYYFKQWSLLFSKVSYTISTGRKPQPKEKKYLTETLELSWNYRRVIPEFQHLDFLGFVLLLTKVSYLTLV